MRTFASRENVEGNSIVVDTSRTQDRVLKEYQAKWWIPWVCDLKESLVGGILNFFKVSRLWTNFGKAKGHISHARNKLFKTKFINSCQSTAMIY